LGRQRDEMANLKELCERITVGHVGPMTAEYLDNGVPFLRSLNVAPFRLDMRDVKYVSQAFHAKLRKSALRPGDLVIVRTGYPGVACVIPESLPESNCADLVVITTSEALNPYYLAAMFNSRWGQAAVAGKLVGVAQQHFNVTAAKEMEVSVPARHVQDRIVQILSTYDELIENNLRRIQILEQMARALYREWFVEFRFPGHEGMQTVASSLGDIPSGWSVRFLGQIADNFDRLRRPLSKIERATMQGEFPYYGAAKVFDYIDRYLFEGEYLLLAEDGSVIGQDRAPVLQLVDEKFWPNNHTHVLRGRGHVSTHLLYLALSQIDVTPYITGAAQPKITQENMNRIPFACGPEQLHRHFDGLIVPMFQQVHCLKRIGKNLRRTRDLLLPRLLSGQITVDEAAA
jgi:type I restriction enzyme S subunit